MYLRAFVLFAVAASSLKIGVHAVGENQQESEVLNHQDEESQKQDNRILWSARTCSKKDQGQRGPYKRMNNVFLRSKSSSKSKRKSKNSSKKYQRYDFTNPTKTQANTDAIPDTIFGGGNTNGFFTCSRNYDLQACIRFKQRVGPNGPVNPDGSWNNEDGSFTVTAGNACEDPLLCAMDPVLEAPFGSWWNLEWSVNVDASGMTGKVIADYDYILAIDVDPSCETCWVNFYPFTLNPLVGVAPGHSFGDNSFTQGTGQEPASVTDVAGFNMLTQTFNVAQNSYNLGFFPLVAAGTGLEYADPSTEGAFKAALRIGHFKDKTKNPTLCNDNFEEILSVEVPYYVDENQPLQDSF